MIRNPKIVREFEDRLCAETPVDVDKNLALASEFLDYARDLGVIPLVDPLEGLDEKVRFVKTLNAFRRTS